MTDDTLDRRTLSERVYERLRERIVSGTLASEAPIRQETIADELGVSKIPVREALGRLEQEGLVVSHAHRGFIVRALSWSEAEDVFRLRLNIEPELAALGAEHAQAQDRLRARQALETLNAALKAGSPASGPLNRDFHLALVQPAPRPISLEMLKRLHALSERYVRVHLGPNGRDERATKEHTALLEAWTARDKEKVSKAAAAHIQATLDDLKKQLGGNGR